MSAEVALDEGVPRRVVDRGQHGPGHAGRVEHLGADHLSGIEIQAGSAS
jgi:hypothetical protein